MHRWDCAASVIAANPIIAMRQRANACFLFILWFVLEFFSFSSFVHHKTRLFTFAYTQFCQSFGLLIIFVRISIKHADKLSINCKKKSYKCYNAQFDRVKINFSFTFARWDSAFLSPWLCLLPSRSQIECKQAWFRLAHASVALILICFAAWN